MEPRYQHSQIGWVGVFLVPALLVGAYVLAETERDLTGAIALAVAGLFVFLLQSRLTVEVTREHLICRFGFTPFRKRILLSEIRSAQRVRNAWYWGWGFRRRRGAWVFNVAGFDAVEIVTSRGRRYRIGTDEPDELLRALRGAAPGLTAPGRTAGASAARA
jgi:hypothetical protein